MSIRWLFIGLSVLIFSCNKEHAEQEADFSITRASSGKYEFSAISDFASDYYWDLGDGSIPEYRKSFSHFYSRPGNYKVSLSVFANNKSGKKEREINVDSTVIPNEIYIKGLALDSGYFSFWDADNSSADIYYAIQKGVIEVHKSYVYTNLPATSIPVVFYEYQPVRLSVWNAVYTLIILDENPDLLPKEIYRLTFNPSDFQSGSNLYPSNIPFSNHMLKGRLFFQYDYL